MYFDFTKLDDFKFYEAGQLNDDELTLILVEKYLGDPMKRWVPAYRFEMQHRETKACMGEVRLRVANTEDIVKYNGHIGYNVAEEYRGNNLAERASRLVLPLAKKHGLDEICITCNPGNLASQRTIELLGGKFVEIVDLPPSSEMYQAGDRQRCRYLLQTS